MDRICFEKASFVKTATQLSECPLLKTDSGSPLSEIAVVGRSNVGKSSLLNHLFRRKGLARASRVPGKTQALNFFSVDNSLLFADLPGYGFAKAPLAVRKAWGPMIENYLQGRAQLKAVLFLLDIRREPTEEDLQFVQFAAHYGTPLILVLTKVDKLKPQDVKKAAMKLAELIGVPQEALVLYSAVSGIGREKLIQAIVKAISNK